MIAEPKLTTMAEFLKLTPRQQGYTLYMEEMWPGSELKGWKAPYPMGSTSWAQFHSGQMAGVQVAQDSEE